MDALFRCVMASVSPAWVKRKPHKSSFRETRYPLVKSIDASSYALWCCFLPPKAGENSMNHCLPRRFNVSAYASRYLKYYTNNGTPLQVLQTVKKRLLFNRAAHLRLESETAPEERGRRRVLTSFAAKRVRERLSNRGLNRPMLCLYA
jgi:hypothetical protein